MRRRGDGSSVQAGISWRSLVLAIVAAVVAACQAPANREGDSGPSAPAAGTPVAARGAGEGGVTAAHPLAVEAGLRVLRAGGSAADAAVAVQAMLGLVEPQSSGIGGGAFLLYYDAATRTVTAFDGRETAPRAATPDLFLDAEGKPLKFADAVTSGRATGVPGVMPMLGELQRRFGRRPWDSLFDAAIESAEQGFTVPRRLGRFVVTDFLPQPRLDPAQLFSRPDGTPIQAGDTWRNPAYAQTLRALSAGGPRTLNTPPIAEAIVARLAREPLPSQMTLEDLAGYEPRISEPLCRPYRIYVVCVPPPPSSGVALLQLLAMLEHTDIAQRGPADARAWLAFVEASRLMYADRDRYIGDPAFVAVPVEALLEADYVASRAALIGERFGATPKAGELAGVPRAADATNEAAGTSHFVVVDGDGNVATMTTTVESLFGSGRVVGGFALNNQLTDFSFLPLDDGRPAANAVAGGKRPRSSMTPVIVLDGQGQVVAALGSPGGSAILAYNAKTLVALLDWKLPLQQAIDLPNLIARGDNVYGEQKKFAPATLEALVALGVNVQGGRGEESGVHGVVRRADGGYDGAADPRREGLWRTVPTPQSSASAR
jgi:gamma-glutamyltranspeptidase/glutathione hydrolase